MDLNLLDSDGFPGPGRTAPSTRSPLPGYYPHRADGVEDDKGGEGRGTDPGQMSHEVTKLGLLLHCQIWGGQGPLQLPFTSAWAPGPGPAKTEAVGGKPASGFTGWPVLGSWGGYLGRSQSQLPTWGGSAGMGRILPFIIF